MFEYQNNKMEPVVMSQVNANLEDMKLVENEFSEQVKELYVDLIISGRDYLESTLSTFEAQDENEKIVKDIEKEILYNRMEESYKKLSEFLKDKKVIIYLKKEGVYRTLSEKVLKAIFDRFINIDYKYEGTGSDIEMVILVDSRLSKKDIDVYVLNKVKKNNGAYFKYTHNTPFNLKSLQILHDSDDLELHNKINSTHCLINSIRYYLKENYGNTEEWDDKSLFIKMENAIGLGQFKSSDMGKILPDWLCVKSQKYEDDMTKGRLHTYTSSNAKKDKKLITHEVKIFLFREHYMPQIKIPGGLDCLKDPKKYNENKYTLASTLIKKLLDQKRFNPSKFCVYAGEKSSDFVLTDDVINQEQKIIVPKDKKPKDSVIVFADFESIVYETEYHLPFALGFIEGSTYNCVLAKTENDLKTCSIFIQMLAILKQKYPKSNNFRIYFHNLKYDYTLIKMNPFIKIVKELERNGQIYQASILYKKTFFTIVDSWKMLSMKLSQFKSNLDLDVGKMNFDLYNIIDTKNYNLDYLELDYFKKILLEREKIEYNEKDFSKYVRDGKYYHLEHYKDYLKLDCITLEKGIKKFRECIFQITGMDLYNQLTISSIAFNNLIKRGCLDGCYAITGNLQKYVMDDVEGGRVCLRNNKKIIVEGEIEDFDAVGLYSSTMSILGFQKGPYEVIKVLEINDIKNKYQEYTFDADVIIHKPQQIPMISHKDKFGVRVWENLVGQIQRVKLNRQKLETLEKHQEIEIVKIYNGVGNLKIHGYNYGVKQVITEYVNERAKVRKANPGLGNAYKLLGNSTYGKTCLSDTKYEIEYVKGEKLLFSRINNNYHKILEIQKINANEEKFNRYRIKKLKPVVGNWNYAHLGSKILATSKCIMNDVLGLANDNNIDIYYTDTDSIHMLKKDVQKLGDLFKEKYNRELIGNDMLQFHTDFESGKISGPVWSKKFIGLGKKCYLDILTNQKGEEDYHIRFKGASSENIIEFCKENNITVEEFYLKLYNGEELTVDITKGKTRFVFSKNSVKTNKCMNKKFKFK